MDLARAMPDLSDLEADLVSLYPALTRRLALVMRDADAAQDVAQAAVTRALENRERFRGSDARAWLYTIGLRLAFNELRRRGRARERMTTQEPSWAMSTDPDLWLALAELDQRHRAALVLSVLEGYTHREIGQMLGVAEGTVSSWVSRARDRLRTLLEDDR